MRNHLLQNFLSYVRISGVGILMLIGGSNLLGGPAPDLSRPVIIGDSLLAGFRNSSLWAEWQHEGISAVIARQAGVSLPLPEIAAPGIPAPLVQIEPSNPIWIMPGPGGSTGRVDVTMQPFNLAVPGHTVADALNKRPDLPVDSLTDLILGLPGLFAGQAKSQVEWAEALKPTMIVAWIGNNDILNAALASDASVMTPEASFTNSFSVLIDRLAATGASLFVANIPDVAAIPYVAPVPLLAQLTGAPLAAIKGALGVSEADYITLDHVPEALAVLQGQAKGPLAANQVLDASEVASIRAATAKFNAFIAAKCAQKGAHLVDMHAFLNRLVSEGAQAGNTHLAASFLGGIFSLDGVHPTKDGAAVTANEFIKSLNAAGARVPLVTWLTVRREGGMLVASWPSDAGNYQLETAAQAKGPWSVNTAPVASENGTSSVRFSTTGNARFFRLSAARL